MATMVERQNEVRLYRGQVPSPGRPTIAWREDNHEPLRDRDGIAVLAVEQRPPRPGDPQLNFCLLGTRHQDILESIRATRIMEVGEANHQLGGPVQLGRCFWWRSEALLPESHQRRFVVSEHR